MKIVSNTKDYYDHQAHIWGVDDRVVYARKSFGRRVMDKDFGFERTEGLVFKLHELPDLPVPEVTYFDSSWQYSYSRHKSGYIVVAGRAFPLIDVNFHDREQDRRNPLKPTPPEKLEIYNPDKHSHLKFARIAIYVGLHGWRRTRHDITREEYLERVMQQSDSLIALCREVGAPVFQVVRTERHRSDTELEIAEHVPNLGALGLPALYPAEQLFQDLSYFMANQIKDSPDLAPEGKPPQTNTEKIEAHGFDLKQSFRHRK